MNQSPTAENYRQLEQKLSNRIEPERIVTQEAKRLAYGTDASFYRLVPKIVAAPEITRRSDFCH